MGVDKCRVRCALSEVVMLVMVLKKEGRKGRREKASEKLETKSHDERKSNAVRAKVGWCI